MAQFYPGWVGIFSPLFYNSILASVYDCVDLWKLWFSLRRLFAVYFEVWLILVNIWCDVPDSFVETHGPSERSTRDHVGDSRINICISHFESTWACGAAEVYQNCTRVDTVLLVFLPTQAANSAFHKVDMWKIFHKFLNTHCSYFRNQLRKGILSKCYTIISVKCYTGLKNHNNFCIFKTKFYM